MNFSLNYNVLNFIILEIILFTIVFFIKESKLKKYIFLGYLLFFSIYLGARSFDIGNDTRNYVNAYLSGDGGYFSELGFKYLGYILYKFKFTSSEYLIFISLLKTCVYYKGYSLLAKDKKNIYILIWISLFTSTSLFGYVNVLRQSIAGGFFLIALGYQEKKEKIKIIISLILGFLFHQSIVFYFLIFIPYFRKKYINLKKIKKLLGIFLASVISIIIPYFFIWNYKFNQYFFIMETNNSFYLKVGILMILYLYLLKENFNKNMEFILYISILIVILFIRFELLGSRLIYYINVYLPIVLFELIRKNKKVKNIIYFFIVIYQILILYYPSVYKMIFI